MNCDVAREALSARIDGEREPVPAARVDEHLAGCADCTDWHIRARRQAELLRGLVGRGGPALTALNPDDDDRAAPARPSRREPALRIALGVVGVTQIGLAALQAGTGDLGIGHGAGHGAHLLNESTAWTLALGVAMLAAALRPVAAAGLAVVLAAFTVVLGGYVVADAIGGAVTPTRVLSHLPVLIAAVLAVLLWRSTGHGGSGTPVGAQDSSAPVVVPDRASPGRRRHLWPTDGSAA